MRCASGDNFLRGGLVLLAFACLLGAGTVMAAEFTMKLGHATANDAQDEIAKLFAREVERISRGRIQATVYNAEKQNRPK
jgi:TRAP-type C4-dicarboxylate transport system substrate-binding protein